MKPILVVPDALFDRINSQLAALSHVMCPSTPLFASIIQESTFKIFVVEGVSLPETEPGCKIEVLAEHESLQLQCAAAEDLQQKFNPSAIQSFFKIPEPVPVEPPEMRNARLEADQLANAEETHRHQVVDADAFALLIDEAKLPPTAKANDADQIDEAELNSLASASEHEVLALLDPAHGLVTPLPEEFAPTALLSSNADPASVVAAGFFKQQIDLEAQRKDVRRLQQKKEA